MTNTNCYSQDSINNRAIQLKNIILSNKIGNPNYVKGCSESEIRNLEDKYGVILPQSYKIFLRYFGHGLGGRVLKDCDILYNDIFNLTERIRDEVLIEEGDPELPEKAFVFLSRYDEQFMFFDADGIEDEPSILRFMIDNEGFSKIGNSIFDIIEDEIQVALNIQLYRQKQ